MNARVEIIDALKGHNITHVLTAQEAQEKLGQESYNSVILDVRAATEKLQGTLDILTSRGTDPPIVALVPEDQMDIAAVVMSSGAFDYTLLPIESERLNTAVNKAAEAQAILNQVLFQKPHIIGQEDHPVPAALMKEIARAETPVLIHGEVGSGVDLIARSLHFNGSRRDGPFVEVACATLTHHLLESEIFGYEKGAVAGGMVHKAGQAELAGGGTLFLENIDAFGLGSQTRLASCLEKGMLQPLGAEMSIPWEARLVASTEVDLAERIRSRGFREDLYSLLSGTVIYLPPLRERKDDIPGLINFMLEKYRRIHRRGPIIFSETILNRLAEYPWPGNIKELEKTIERYVLAGVMPAPETLPSEDEVMGIEPLRKGPKAPPRSTPLKKAARAAERELIIKTLNECEGNKRMAARSLRISYKTLFNKLHQYGIVTKMEFE